MNKFRALMISIAAATVAFASVSHAEKPAEADNFTVEAKPASAAVGADGKAVFTIKVAEGYKWNKDYPAKVTVAGAPDNITLKKTTFSQMKGDFETTKEIANVAIPFVGKTAGKNTVKVAAKFSICNDKVCLIKKAETEVALNVTE